MFSQATSKIINIDCDVKNALSRISSCENEIYRLRCDTHDDSSIWTNIREHTYQINNLRESVEKLTADITELTMQIQDLSAKLRPALDAKTENPKQNLHLEIFEENDRFNNLKCIDLDDVKNEKGIWELYDEKWWDQ